MSIGVNQVNLMGYLGSDPKVNKNNEGTIAHVSMATGSAWIDKKTGNKMEHTEWHNIVFFGKLAEIVEQYLKKGTAVFITGKLRTRKWQDKNTGTDRYTTEIVANKMNMLSSKKQEDLLNEEVNPYKNTNNNNPQNQAESQHEAYSDNNFNDDIPF